MSTVSLKLRRSLHRKLSELADGAGVSLNQLISSAAAEKLAALMTTDYLTGRAERTSRRKFAAVLRKIPKARPVPGDEIPARYPKKAGRKAG